MQILQSFHRNFSHKSGSASRLIIAVSMIFLVGFVSFQLPALALESPDFIFAEEEDTAHSNSINETLAKEVFVTVTNYSISPALFQEEGGLYLHFAEAIIPCLHLETDEQPPNLTKFS